MAPSAIRGDTIWCIGMSEPNAGSDLAGLQTRAEVFDDHFVVNGQKVWTSYAMIAQKCFCYVRTDPTLPKHKGISLLIIDMDTPGIDIRPLRHINGHGRLRRGVLHRRGRPAREPRRRAQRRLGASRRDRSRTSAPACGSRASAASSRPSPGSSSSRGSTAAPTTRSSGARSRSSTSSRRACARWATRASPRSRRARPRPSTRYMKMATSEAGKAAYELGMEIAGPLAAGHRRHVRASRAAGRTASSCRSRTRSRAAAPRSSATSSPSACSGSRGR